MKEFRKSVFLQAKGKEVRELCQRLSEELSDRLRQSSEFHSGVEQAVSELRTLGHDLWHINASEDFELWGPNYLNPDGPSLVTTFKSPGSVNVEWSVS